MRFAIIIVVVSVGIAARVAAGTLPRRKEEVFLRTFREEPGDSNTGSPPSMMLMTDEVNETAGLPGVRPQGGSDIRAVAGIAPYSMADHTSPDVRHVHHRASADVPFIVRSWRTYGERPIGGGASSGDRRIDSDDSTLRAESLHQESTILGGGKKNGGHDRLKTLASLATKQTLLQEKLGGYALETEREERSNSQPAGVPRLLATSTSRPIPVNAGDIGRRAPWSTTTPVSSVSTSPSTASVNPTVNDFGAPPDDPLVVAPTAGSVVRSPSSPGITHVIPNPGGLAQMLASTSRSSRVAPNPSASPRTPSSSSTYPSRGSSEQTLSAPETTWNWTWTPSPMPPASPSSQVRLAWRTSSSGTSSSSRGGDGTRSPGDGDENRSSASPAPIPTDTTTNTSSRRAKPTPAPKWPSMEVPGLSTPHPTRSAIESATRGKSGVEPPSPRSASAADSAGSEGNDAPHSSISGGFPVDAATPPSVSAKSPTDPPVSVGVPIPGPISGAGGKQDRVDTTPQPFVASPSPSARATSAPAIGKAELSKPSELDVDVPTSSPSERIRLYPYLTVAPSSSPSTAGTEAGRIEVPSATVSPTTTSREKSDDTSLFTLTSSPTSIDIAETGARGTPIPATTTGVTRTEGPTGGRMAREFGNEVTFAPSLSPMDNDWESTRNTPRPTTTSNPIATVLSSGGPWSEERGNTVSSSSSAPAFTSSFSAPTAPPTSSRSSVDGGYYFEEQDASTPSGLHSLDPTASPSPVLSTTSLSLAMPADSELPTAASTSAPRRTETPRFLKPSSSSDEEEREGEWTPIPAHTGSANWEGSPPPSTGSLSWTPTASPDGQMGEAGRVVEDDDFNNPYHYDDDEATSAPSAAPSPVIPRIGGDEFVVHTPPPTNPPEDVWMWWFQTGGQRTDRVHALALGSGGNGNRRYLVGREDGVVDPNTTESTAATPSGVFAFNGDPTDDHQKVPVTHNADGAGDPWARRLHRRRMQSDTGSRSDVSVICLSSEGLDLWHMNVGSAGEDMALSAGTAGDHVAIGGYTTGDLFSDNNGEDDAFLGLLNATNGDVLAGWQFGGADSERLYALEVDDESGDVIVGGYTTGSLFADNADAISQSFLARLETEYLLSSSGWLDLSDENSDVVVWGWQYSTSSSVPETIVSVRIDSKSDSVTALGVRGIPPEANLRDADFSPDNETELASVVLSLALSTGELLWTSVELEGVGTALAIDEESGDAFVAGFTTSSTPGDGGGVSEKIAVHKVDASTGTNSLSYEATSEDVSDGRGLAVDFFGNSGVLVAGTASGNAIRPSVGKTDMFMLLVDPGDLSRICYYQVGTEATDVVTGISVNNSGATVYPDIAVGGYTEGSFAGNDAGGGDIFAIGVDLLSVCSHLNRSTSDAFWTDRGSFAAGAVSILAGMAIVGAVVSVIITPAAVASAGGPGGAGRLGVGATVTANDTVNGGAATTEISACPAMDGGAGTSVSILSPPRTGAGGLVGNSSPPPGGMTFRSPSASVGLLVMAQLQFLALLSLVHSVRDSTSSLGSFVENLRWVNLWLPIPSNLTPDSCEVADSEALMDEEVFFGNTAMVFGTLLGIFVTHVAVISVVEAYWFAQDRATATLKSVRKLHGMTAADVDSKLVDNQSRGRGRFSAVGYAASSDAERFSPRSPHHQFISFGDVEDSAKPQSPSPSPASDAESPRCLSPPVGLGSQHPDGVCSATSAYADDYVSTTEGDPNRQSIPDARHPLSPANAVSIWTNNNGPQERRMQQSLHQEGHGVPLASNNHPSLTTTPKPNRKGDDGSSKHSSGYPSNSINQCSSDLSPMSGLPTPTPGPSWSPQGPVEWGIPPPNTSSLSRRMDDRGGKSLPGSPTRGGGRYGRSDELYPHHSSVSSVRSASPTSLYWDSPIRITDASASGRRMKPADQGEESEMWARHVRDSRPSVGLDCIRAIMTGPVTPEPGGGTGGTLALRQQTATTISDSGSIFDDGMVIHSGPAAATARKDFVDGGGEGLRHRRGGNRGAELEIGQAEKRSRIPTKGLLEQPDSQLNPILAFRQRSGSMWLHFPHLELLFLFWAFEGAVAAQVSALKNAECPRVFWMALVALLMYPVLMVIMVWRTVTVRIRPNERLLFILNGIGGNENRYPAYPAKAQRLSEQHAEEGADSTLNASETEAERRPKHGLWGKFVQCWVQKGMLFAWADIGSWASVATHDQEVKREADWFRIGFEPLFVDFSKLGSFYLIFLLVKWCGLACAGALVEESVKQLLYMFFLHAVDVAVLIRAPPFANRAVNVMNAILAAVDCASSALMLGAAGFDEDETSTFNDLAFALQLAALVALVIPVYIDTGVSLTIVGVDMLNRQCGARRASAIRTQSLANATTTTHAERAEEQERREYVRRSARRSWPRFWCSMVRHNVVACAADILEGIRAPGSAPHSRFGHRRHQRRGRTKAGRPNRGWLSKVRVCGIRCGVSAAPTLPVPASAPHSCNSADERDKQSFCDAEINRELRGGNRAKQRIPQEPARLALPPKLRGPGRGAGSLGDDTRIISRRSSRARRPPSPVDPGRCRLSRRSKGWTAAGVTFPSASPAILDEPRKKTYDGASSSRNHVQHGDGSGNSSVVSVRGDTGKDAKARSRGRGLTSMFSTHPVALDEPRKNVYRMGRGRGGGNTASYKGGWAKGLGTKEMQGIDASGEGAGTGRRGGKPEEEGFARQGASGRALVTTASYTWEDVDERSLEESGA